MNYKKYIFIAFALMIIGALIGCGGVDSRIGNAKSKYFDNINSRDEAIMILRNILSKYSVYHRAPYSTGYVYKYEANSEGIAIFQHDSSTGRLDHRRFVFYGEPDYCSSYGVIRNIIIKREGKSACFSAPDIIFTQQSKSQETAAEVYQLLRYISIHPK